MALNKKQMQFSFQNKFENEKESMEFVVNHVQVMEKKLIFF